MMSIHALKFAAFVLAGSLPGTASAAEPTAVISISVSNPMVAPRAHETVAVALAEILKTSPYADKSLVPTIQSIAAQQAGRDADRAEFATLLENIVAKL